MKFNSNGTNDALEKMRPISLRCLFHFKIKFYMFKFNFVRQTFHFSV
jgi:hypothetical protein